MYYIQDAHSFWDWSYFVALIVVSNIKNLKRQNETDEFANSLDPDKAAHDKPPP